MSERVFNFSAGPATLPAEVIDQVKADLPVYDGCGASILEISHRSREFEAVLEETEANLRALLGLPDAYRVLFLQGGAYGQFAMVPMNFLAARDAVADYVITGAWGDKARAEAERAGRVHVAWDGGEHNYRRVPGPGEVSLTPGAAYVHVTSNETIHGVQFADALPTGEVPLVCDASSDFLCRPTDVSTYGLIYAGAQKNLGPAGLTLVIIHDDLVAATPAGQYSMFSYRVHAESGSTFNTPPCFAIYVVGLVTRWLRHTVGGLEAMERLNQRKAGLLYDAIDGSGGFYRGHAEPDSRSLMNVTMTLADPSLESRFVKEATAAGLHGLKGHRSVGGLRASIYNAMPVDGVEALVQFMAEFQRRAG